MPDEGLIRHLFAVQEATLPLALAWGADPAEATIAALFHDIERDTTTPPFAAALADLGLPYDDGEAEIPVLWHAPAAALYLARANLANPRILAAVRYHTTGRPGMSSLEIAILVGDRVSKDRAGREAEALRALLPPAGRLGPREAARKVLEAKIAKIRASGRAPLARTLAALADVA